MSTKIDLRELAVDRRGDIAPRPRWVSRVILPAVLLGGFAAVVGWSARETWLRGQAVTVVPVLASRSEVRQEGTPLFKAAGWIEPRPTPIRVAALAGGVIDELLVVEDQAVTEGEPIARLVRRDAELALQTSLAEVQLQQAAVDRADARRQAAKTRFEIPVHLEAQVAEAETQHATLETELATLPYQIEKAEADLAYQQINLERMERLDLREAVARDKLDRARRDHAASQAALEELRARVPKLEQERDALERRASALRRQYELKADERQAVGEAEAEAASARAGLARAKAALAEAELTLERMTVRAPATGRVLDLVAGPGSRLVPDMIGQERGFDGMTVVTMYRPDQLQVRVDVRFEDLPKVVAGQQVVIQSPALTQPLTGTVLFLTSIANIQKNTLEVKVGLESPPPVLKPEMLVEATFLAPPREGGDVPSEELRIYIPRKLVEQGQEGQFVWIADVAAGVARRRRIETAASSGPLVEVTAGLNVSSRLISAGREGLEDGERILVTGEDGSVGTDEPDRSQSNPGE